MISIESMREGQALKAKLGEARAQLESLSDRIEGMDDRERQWLLIAIDDVDHACSVLDELFG